MEGGDKNHDRSGLTHFGRKDDVTGTASRGTANMAATPILKPGSAKSRLVIGGRATSDTIPTFASHGGEGKGHFIR